MKEAKKYLGMLAIIILVGIYLFTNNGKTQNTDGQQNKLNNTISIYTEELIKVHYIDQTTPNMIQGLKGIFARKPLISIGI